MLPTYSKQLGHSAISGRPRVIKDATAAAAQQGDQPERLSALGVRGRLQDVLAQHRAAQQWASSEPQQSYSREQQGSRE